MSYLNKQKMLQQLEEDLAKAKGQLSELTHFRKIVLAEQVLKAKKEGAKSIAEAEAVARASDEYKTVCLGLAQATENEAILWFKLKRLQMEMGIL